MTPTINRTPRLFAPAEAERIATALQAGEEDGWSYTADHDPKGTGYSRVEIRDEDGELVDYLT